MRYKVNCITFIRNNTLDDFINRRDVNNIEYIRFGSYISLYELLLEHEVSVEDVRYYGAEETTEIQIIKDFTDKGYIIGIKNVEDLHDAIIKSKTFEPVKYQPNNSKMLKIIENFIENI